MKTWRLELSDGKRAEKEGRRTLEQGSTERPLSVGEPSGLTQGSRGGPGNQAGETGAGEGDGHIREIRPQISQILRKLSVYSSEQLSAPQAQKYDGNDTNEPLNTLVQTQ